MRTLLTLIFGAGLLIGVRCVEAQVTVTYRSLEARIVAADVVVRGTIIKLTRTVQPSRADRDPSLNVRYSITVSVDEALSGEPSDTIELQCETWQSDRRFEQWQERRTSFLWFVQPVAEAEDRLPDAAARARPWESLRLDEPVPGERGFAAVGPPVFSMDLTVLSKPEEILAAARQFCRQREGASKTFTFTIPHVVAKRCSPTGDANFLKVPVHKSLEPLAKRLLASPADFLPANIPPDDWSASQLRLGGAKCLQFFQSPENIALLKSLLADPTEVKKSYVSGPRQGTVWKTFPIRAAAHEILTSWGVDVPQSVVEEIVPPSKERAQWKQSIERPRREWEYDGERILGHVGQDICLWDAAIGKLLHKMTGHKERIHAVQFSPDGSLALSSSWMGQGAMTMRISRDTSVILWDLATGRERHNFKGQVAGEFNPDGKYVVTFSQRPGTGIPVPDWGESTIPGTGEVWQNGTEAKFDAAVWDALTGRQLVQAKLVEHADPRADTLHFSPDGQRFVYLANGGFLPYNSSEGIVFNASDGRELGRVARDEVKFGDGHRYTSSGALAIFEPTRARLIDFESGQVVHSVPHDQPRRWGVAWTHDGSRVAVIPDDESEIKILDIRTGQVTTGAKNGPYPQHRAIVSPDNRRLAVEWGGANGLEPGLGLYDMNTGQEIARIKLAKWREMIGFSPDSRTLLVGGSEFAIYNSLNGEKIRALNLLAEVNLHDWNG